ncbi:hypothetical protein H6F92_02145 [Microcystis wesenbergii FACHB-1317]|uniref:hypothetical protein n=1 Tax=Microcystis aeruginosa TaxID=1126 RepID=UPI00199B237E|nr:hypothetical protein [Microcystis aeruginosa]MBD2287692.1 hypothetical protein [Microcystis wesenbergii FACHB-1317]UZO75532.1 hypothetical protein M8120_22675 [Microcystis aeruginosa str. Chao 1910]
MVNLKDDNNYRIGVLKAIAPPPDQKAIAIPQKLLIPKMIVPPPDPKAIAITQKLLLPKMIAPRIPIPSNGNFKV